MDFNILLLHVMLIFKIVHGWLWQCSSKDGLCTRVLDPKENEAYPTLQICQLLCGDANHLNIWPYPTGNIQALKNLVLVNAQNITFQIHGPDVASKFLGKVVDYFKENLKYNKTSICQEYAYDMNIVLRTLSDSVALTLETDEHYNLQMTFSDGVFTTQIVGNTVFGVRHGIETLLQLLLPYEKPNSTCLATLIYTQLTDEPVYPHRGLLIDTARNYLSPKSIKKNIDGMAASKMNVLHWHITDSQSFPLVSPSLPNMTKYGAYDEKSIYTPKDISDLVNYAEVRGVRILMEIDGPSHAGNGWQWGPEAGLGNLSVCINKQPWRSFCIQPPCGQLNPANPNLYKILNTLYKDIVKMLPSSKMFHMGGDEVFIPCWNSTEEIIKYLNGKQRTIDTFLNLWGEYHKKTLAAYDDAVGHNKTLIPIWTSHLTEPDVIEKYLPKERYIIHAWIEENNQDYITTILNMGYRVILSTKDRWYLDHGFWGFTNYYNWKTVYENKMYKKYDKSILGGEVCMWGELVDDHNIESRVWPRAAAAAERLWTNPKNGANKAKKRFYAHRERLISRDINAEAELPAWCIQNEGECIRYL